MGTYVLCCEELNYDYELNGSRTAPTPTARSAQECVSWLEMESVIMIMMHKREERPSSSWWFYVWVLLFCSFFVLVTKCCRRRRSFPLGKNFYTLTWEFIMTQAEPDGKSLKEYRQFLNATYLGTYLLMSVIAIFSYSEVGRKLNRAVWRQRTDAN